MAMTASSRAPQGAGSPESERSPFARLAGQEKWLNRPPPTLGEHNDEVLRDDCGLTGEELARLAATGVIGTRPKGV